MTHDYSHQNLQGRSFKRQNLRNANFSYADIRSTDFTGANLTGANFHDAIIGQQRIWKVLLLLQIWLIAGISSFFATVYGFLTSSVFGFSLNDSDRVAGLFSLMVLMIFFGIAIRQGVNCNLAIVFTIIILITIIALVNLSFEIAKSGVSRSAYEDAAVDLGLLCIAFALATFATVIGVIAGKKSKDLGKNLLVTVFVSVAVAFNVTLGLLNFNTPLNFKGFMLNIIFSVLSIYTSRKIFSGDQKYAVVLNAANYFKKIGTTSFRNADLTDANFTRVALTSADFHGCNLTRISEE